MWGICDCISGTPEGRPSLSLCDFWSVCYLSFPLWKRRSDWLCQECVRPQHWIWDPSWAGFLWSCFTNDGRIYVSHKALSWGASIRLPGNLGHQWEVVLPRPHRLEGWRCRMRSWYHLVEGCFCLLLLYISGYVWGYILELERSVGDFIEAVFKIPQKYDARLGTKWFTIFVVFHN